MRQIGWWESFREHSALPLSMAALASMTREKHSQSISIKPLQASEITPGRSFLSGQVRLWGDRGTTLYPTVALN
ncbi:MAG: hypothetical protein ACFB0G_10845 [Leptolyngbyaceae cyanobacterium]